MKLTEKQEKYIPIKRGIDIVLSGAAIVLLSPVLGGLSLAIKLDSKGPILFKQKRVGKNKELFEIWKFRTMKTDTPKDMPTHMLSDPEQYITRVGKFLRKTSLDELPQLFNIFKGEMSIIGPRPALWNQDDLIEERDKYGANGVTPGLTGWAQINGRDELEIPVKARLDGEYVEQMSFSMDVKCFLGTIGSVLLSDGVVEGGTGEMEEQEKKSVEVSPEKIKKETMIGASIVGTATLFVMGIFFFLIKKNRKNKTENKKENCILKAGLIGGVIAEGIATIYTNIKRHIRFADDFVNEEIELPNKAKLWEAELGEKCTKKILITGANSYIGTAVDKWLSKEKEKYLVDTLDMIGNEWRSYDFSSYDVIYHVAGIAHADVGSVSEEEKQLYYKVNRDLALEVAEKAKVEGVKQFIFMSSMIVYSGCKKKIITSETEPKALNFYGDSKLQADIKIRELETEAFKVVVLRPPMIYGKGSKGNYPQLSKLASKLPVFPIVNNKRSMLHIDNLCEFVKLMIDNEEAGVFFPQNKEYSNTSDMVEMIANVKGHSIVMIPGAGWGIKLLAAMPGKIGGLASKAFGDSVYDMKMSEYKEEYRVNSLRKSIELTEE